MGKKRRASNLSFFLGMMDALPLLWEVLNAHIGHVEPELNQDVPAFLLKVMSRYEHIFMRAIYFLSSRDWMHSRPWFKTIVDRIGDAVISSTNGEILCLDEAGDFVSAVAEHGYTMAVGTCPCRRARNMLSDNLPNNTDMVFGRWADAYLENYPGLYRKLELEEALALIESFDRLGFVHQIYGWNSRQDAAFVLCNCCPEVCIPILAFHARGYKSFRKGRNLAVVDEERCIGLEECGICLKRCPFDARTSLEGKAKVDPGKCYGCGLCVSTCRGGATALERRPGSTLIYARSFVSD